MHQGRSTAARLVFGPKQREVSTVPNLIGIDECEGLTTKEVHDLYRRYVSRTQVSLMTSFGFGRDLVERAEGPWIHMRDGTRVLDLSGGVGVLNHGHNHPRIAAAEVCDGAEVFHGFADGTGARRMPEAHPASSSFPSVA